MQTIDKKTSSDRARTAKALEEYWDRSSQNYEERHELANTLLWQETLGSFIGSDRKLKILDVGTGTGMIAHMLAGCGYENISGADLSEGMMSVARRHAEEAGFNINYLHANALELPWPDESLDAVISSRLLWTLPETAAAIAEWLRVLKKGGRIIAINELEGEGIRFWSFDDPAAYLGADIPVEPFSFANTSAENILETFRNAGVADISLHHMKGCHMVRSDKENWYAFVGSKH